MGFVKDFGISILIQIGRLAFVFFVIAGLLANYALNNPSSATGFGFDTADTAELATFAGDDCVPKAGDQYSSFFGLLRQFGFKICLFLLNTVNIPNVTHFFGAILFCNYIRIYAKCL